MVLLATVTLFSVMVAVIAGWWQGPPSSAAEARPQVRSQASSQITLADPAPVRMVGARFEPNISPRDR
jgi:hypothetical protein